MYKCIIMEIKKAFTNKMFLIALSVGCLLAVLHFIRAANIYSYQKEIGVQSGINITPIFLVSNEWLGGVGDIWSSIFFFIFPLLAAIPYGWSYCIEKKSGYTRTMIVHTGRKTYFFSKYLAVFLTGGAVVAIPMIFSVLVTMLLFPSAVPLVEYDTSYGVFSYDLMAELYYTQPYLYILLYICIDFIFCGLISCIAMTASSFIKQKWIVIILPFFLLLVIDFLERYINNPIKMNVLEEYHAISPFRFLNPGPKELPASIGVIAGMAAVIFVVTFFISIVWEKRREIY